MLAPKVLLVNDDPASLLALESVLSDAEERNEYELMTARSGEEALRQVLNHEFAVILLDASMPTMDGFETAEAIHSHPRSASVPIIFITAHYADEINRLKAYQKGAVDYLFTPVIPKILQTKVAIFVELARKNQELRARTKELARLNLDLRVQRIQDLQRINMDLQAEIVDRKLAEKRAIELATRDALTGLLNRRSLIEQLDHAVAHAARQQQQFALLFLDLDKFKAINDSLGHEVGDELLRQVAARLIIAVRESDAVARLGGDEFVVLLDSGATADDASRVAQKIVQANARPYVIGAHRVNTSASIGVGMYPNDGTSAQTVMRSADLAMYHAKKLRRGSIQFFHESMNLREAERGQLEQELQDALDRDEFDLYFQPKVDIKSGCATGLEVLLHWRHPRLGLLPATQFTAAAASGLLAPINEWMLCAACAQAQRWLNSDLPALQVPIAVNLATPHLQPDLPSLILDTLHKYKLPNTALQLEISESVLAHDYAKAGAILRKLSDHGVTLAIDNFGAGFSSLAVLKSLPLDILKIDRTFVQELNDRSGRDSLPGAVINVARALSLRTVAQGVETDEQLTVLKALGCDEYQGDLYSPALPAEALEAKLRHLRVPHAFAEYRVPSAPAAD